MKRIVVMLVAVACVALQASFGQDTVLSEGFEETWSGGAPAGWSSQYLIGSVNWEQQPGGYLFNPPTAHSGTYNAYLRYPDWTPRVTLLITPVMDLSPTTYSNAVLTYWLAQHEWYGDQDYSYVYYRTSPSASWQLIPGATFTTDIENWTKITLTLPNISETYQIGFAGETRFGYGVCIDDVTVVGNYSGGVVGFTPVNTLADPHGAILPDNPMVLAGSDLELDVIPDDHYRIADVVVNGESVGPVDTVLLEDIIGPQFVSASFLRVFVDNDFNGDDIADLGLYYPATGTWYIKNTAGVMSHQFGWASAIPVAADYDGDGETDMAVYWPDGGRWFISLSSSATFSVIDWGWSAAVPVPADYNGDGKANVAIYVPASGEWYIRDPDGKTRMETLGSSSEVPIPADYDGDGKADIGVYDINNGDWSIVRSSTLMPLTFDLGGAGALPVPGDYNGDGKAEPVIYTPATGTWGFIPAMLPGPSEINWGWSAAMPVPADYDGDGKVDIAVFVRSTGDWYILRDNMQILTYNFGWSATEPTTPAYQALAWFGLVP